MFKTVRTGNYSQSAKAVVGASDQIFDAAMSSKPDFTAIAKEAIKGRSLERRAVTKAEADVASAGLKAFTDVTRIKNDIESEKKINDIKRPAKRMAGVVAGLGALSQAAVMNKNLKEDRADREAFKTEQEAINAKTTQMFADQQKSFDEMMATLRSGLTNTSSAVSTPNQSGSDNSGFTQTQPTGSGSAPSVPSISKLTGNSKTLADAIAKYESGDYGYEAFNQGGAAGGTKVVGKSGSHKNVFGNSLTDMTLSDIFHRQNTKQRGLSMQEHLDSGGLHAVGRYQFIGSTLQDEVKRMGLDPKTTKFTPEIQDQIFLSHIKRVGNISPWVGPMQNYSQAERDRFNNMISQL